MPDLTRFGVSIEKGLIRKFDRLIKEENYANRSEAFRDLIREKLVKKQWLGREDVAGAITLVYGHHKRELLNTLTDIQHDYYRLIVSAQHVHLSRHNCLEIVVVKGKAKQIQCLADKMRAVKGVKHSALTMATTGKAIS